MRSSPRRARCAGSPTRGRPAIHAASVSRIPGRGDELILVNYEHHPVASPYRMRFAVYVRKGEEQFDAIDEVPAQLRCRTLAVRGFDAEAMMVAWEVVEGRDLEA